MFFLKYKLMKQNFKKQKKNFCMRYKDSQYIVQFAHQVARITTQFHNNNINNNNYNNNQL